MENNHIAWNASLIDKLSSLRIRYTALNTSVIEQSSASLHHYGFTLLARDGDDHDAATELQNLSEKLGTLLPQSPRREMIEDVRDYSDVDEKDERGYRSGGALGVHSDPPTMIALHCLQPAKRGGESYLVNVRALHDAIGISHPELLEVLYQGFPHWNVQGQADGPCPAKELRPIFIKKDGMVSCVHYRPFTEMAADALDQPLSAKQVAALDIFDHYANSIGLALRFTLQPGDTMVLHNRTVLHARTEYEDWQQQDKRRHLLRTWIDAPQLLPVDPQHELGDLFA